MASPKLPTDSRRVLATLVGWRGGNPGLSVLTLLGALGGFSIGLMVNELLPAITVDLAVIGFIVGGAAVEIALTAVFVQRLIGNVRTVADQTEDNDCS